MKKRIFIICSLIVLIGVFLFLLFFWQQDRGLIEYRDEELGISFRYPLGWQEVDPASRYQYYDDTDVIFIKPISTVSNFGVKIVEEERFEGFDVLGTIRELDESLAEQLEGFVKISSERITFLDAPGFEYVFRYSAPADFRGGMQQGIQREIGFVKDGKLYFLMFYAAPADYERDLEDFERVVGSFKIE